MTVSTDHDACQSVTPAPADALVHRLIETAAAAIEAAAGRGLMA